IAPAQIGMNRPPLDRPRTDEGDLDDEVVKTARPQPGQCGHLRPALDLEDPHRVAGAQHVVYGLFLRDQGKVDLVVMVGGDGVDSPVDRLEHPETQEVELHEPGGGAIVLVPLEHGPVLHTGPFDRANLRDGAITDHHASWMDAEVAGKALQLGRHREHGGRDPELVRLLLPARLRCDVVTTGASITWRPGRGATSW